MVHVPPELSARYPLASTFAEAFLLALGPTAHPPTIKDAFDDVGMCLTWYHPRTVSVYVWESQPVSDSSGSSDSGDEKEASGMVVVPKICSYLSGKDPVTLATYAANHLSASPLEVCIEEIDAMPLKDPRAKSHARLIAEISKESGDVPTCTFDSTSTIKLSWMDRKVVVGPHGVVE